MGTRWVALLALVAASGCDALFNLDHHEASIDARLSDARQPDVPFDVAVDAAEACPPDYATITDGPARSVYRYVSTYDVWSNAEADCEDDTMTHITHLVVLDDAAETTAVVTYLSSSPTHAGYARNVQDDPQTFFAVTGAQVPAGDPVWAANEPNNGNGFGPEPVTWFSYYGLVDEPTTYNLAYLCECDHAPVTKNFVLQ